MQASQQISQFLENKGIAIIFNLPGIHTLPLNHILLQSNIDLVTVRHESNAAFMADGYARATGKPGVVLVTPGPGLGNVVSACMEAYGSDVPLMIIFVDVDQKDVEKGVLHGVKAPEAMFANICKAVFVVTGEKDLAETLENAYRTAMSGRPGPVVVSVPFRILDREPARVEWTEPMGEEGGFDADFLEEALKGAERPVIVGGGGLVGKNLGEALGAICRGSSIPFLTTTSGKGVVSEDRDYFLGHVTGKGVTRKILRSADRVVALGTRLRAVDSKKRGVKIGSLIHIDVDDRWIGRNYRDGLAMAGDPGRALDALGALMTGRKSAWDPERLLKAREEERAALKRDNEGFRVIDMLRRVIPRDTVTVWDLTMCGYWAECYFPVFEERTFLFPKGASPIFYAFPAALGAKLGRKGNPCLCVTGDGSFLPAASELATMASSGVPVVTLVCNNGSFGVLEDSMRRRYGAEGTMALTNPDYQTLARSFGIKAKRAASLEELEHLFLHHITWDEPCVIEFQCPIFSPPW